MNKLSIVLLCVVLFAVTAIAGPKWRIHDTSRPNPNIITPGTFSTQDTPGQPPSDAVILFDGKDLKNWRSMDGNEAKWIVKNGFMESVRGSGYIRTLRNFGSCQLHVEFSTPTPPMGESQGRGNSGVFLMGNYEVQVLDNFDNVTYADGQCSAIYGQYPPQVNVCRKPGEWQTYDIIFHAPVFNAKKELEKPADITVFQNGVLTQDHVEILGPTNWTQRQPYSYHTEKLPLSLQDHGNPVRYRNIWVRELPAPGPGQPQPMAQITLPNDLLQKYAGDYGSPDYPILKIRYEDGELAAAVGGVDYHPIYAESETRFVSGFVDLVVEFHTKDGTVETADFYVAGGKTNVPRVK